MQNKTVLSYKAPSLKGELPIGSTVYLYTGEGKYLGSGRILSEPEEKEQGRRGLFKRRRNQFNLGLDEYLGKKVEKMKSREKTKMFHHIEANASLISELLICEAK